MSDDENWDEAVDNMRDDDDTLDREEILHDQERIADGDLW
jgi:hypothetical protein